MIMSQTLRSRRSVGTNLAFLMVSLLIVSFASSLVAKQDSSWASLSQLSLAATGSPAYKVMPNPARLQEGYNTTITVEAQDETANATVRVNLNVTDPSGAPPYVKTLQITTNGTGFGSNSTQYWGKFTGGANTKYVGRYTISVNETLARANFTVGLTDKSAYKRNETVSLRAVGYQSSENITVSLKIGNTMVAGYPKTLQADINGVVTHNWAIPSDAMPGTYRISLVSTALQTVKTPADEDIFTVLGGICTIKTVNLASQTVAGAVVEVYNVTTDAYLNLQGATNSSGMIQFGLDVGNYTFKAFFKNVQVGNLTNQNVTTDITLIVSLRLVNLVATVETEAGEGVPFIDIAVKHNYTMRNNITTSEIASAQTNLTGTATVHNLFTNITYEVEATRYGLLFNRTIFTVEFLPSSLLNLNLTLPTYALNVHAVDSQNKPAGGVQVRVYEWSAGITTPLQTSEIGTSGDVSFLLPFGKYRLRTFKGLAFLNESVVNLIENPLNLTLYLVAANVQVTVSTFDYFGQPIANAEVKIERKIDQEYVPADSGFTGADGSTVFNLPAGGDSRISVYVAGRLAAVKTQFLGAGSSQMTFNIGEYVSISGYPIETGLFALSSFILVLAVVFLFLARRRLMRIFSKKPKR